MSEPIDHYAKAVELARIAEVKAVDTRHYAAVAQLHLQLAAARPARDDPYWEQAGQLEALTEAVQAAERAIVDAGSYEEITLRRDLWDAVVRLTRGESS